MEKRTLYALVGMIALGAIAFAVLRAPEKGQRKGPPPRPVAPLKASDITRLELTNEKQEKTVLEKSGPANEWRIKEPSDWKADQTGVKQVVDGLEKLTFGDTVSENAEKQGELGVADGKGARVVARAGDKTLVNLLVGKTVGGFTMVRLAGKNEVWQANGLYPYAIGRDPKGWRDHAIFDFPVADVEKLTVEAGADKLVLAKQPAEKDKPNETKWKVESAAGAAPANEAALDPAQANQAAQGMATLHASDFVENQKKDELVKSATVKVTAMVKGQPHTLFVVGGKDDDVWVASSDSPTVYAVKKYSLDRVARKPFDYRDKTLVKAKGDELSSVDITTGAETSTLTQGNDGKWALGKGAADDTKVKPVVAAFENLQADGFSEEKDPAKTGLAKPAGQAVLHLKNKQSVTIKVGAATKDGDYYVQKLGTPDVYRVKKFAVDRWLKKPADLTKK